MFSYFEPNFNENFLWESVFFFFFFLQILTKIEMTRNKYRLFGRHFETIQHFEFFFPESQFFVYIHIRCKFLCKIPVEKWFSYRGSMESPPPLGTNRSESTLVTYMLRIHLCFTKAFNDKINISKCI